ncbi:mitochondrial 54S ribosomal protein YmL35 [Malassezia caprae]|uniref:Mitochondrial 54S ribosomal protein YmL35 n=1 Tax=Malassezia caprae TaxID=1381934 RepID=A0AAF0E719_9BASI|nr:mitochondrial 54S ribosomal protein YmL35 [Malassezia caprae]
MNSSSSWQPAVKPGSMPVYDQALAYIEADAAALRKKMEEIKQSGEAQEEYLDALEIVSEINRPSVRAQFTKGEYDLSQPVFRHLREQAWRLGGALERLVERIQLMHVLPDVAPSITPTVDLEVFFGEGAGIGDHGGSGGSVHPGVFLDPALVRTDFLPQTREAPMIRATVFHKDTRKYTIMLVDPDAPCEDSQSFKTYVHWLVTDVPLSLREQTIPSGHAHKLAYVPPHPQCGTPYHRYTMLLFEQQSETPVGDVARDGVQVQAYAEQNGLALRGIHFWRCAPSP